MCNALFTSVSDKKRTNTLFQARKSIITLKICIEKTQIQILCEGRIIIMKIIKKNSFNMYNLPLIYLTFLTNAVALRQGSATFIYQRAILAPK